MKRRVIKGGPRRILGIDQSLNESAFMLLQGGKMVDYIYYTPKKALSEKFGDHGIRIPPDMMSGQDRARLEKLNFLRETFLDAIKNRFRPDAVLFEGYAYGVRSSSVFQLGELGGLLRLLLRPVCPMFLMDPSSLKLYATGKAQADKTAMVVACLKKWEKIDFTDHEDISHNLADAYIAAQLMTEMDKVKRGKLALTDLKAHTQKVLQRVTKSYPESLITQASLGVVDYE